MKKITLFLALIALFTTINLFSQTVWKQDPNHSKVGFTVTHLSITDITGYFTKFDVSITSSQADFSDAVVELTADINSINTGIEARDNHLRTADFFDAATYPTMTFKSTSIERSGENSYKLKGDLTMHGVTKEITVDMIHRGTIQNPMANNAEVAGIQITGSLKRSDFGIGPKFPEFAISDEVRIKADGEFSKK
ncbi:MAG TPA: YceI family protein [Ignavibacteria bacterium]|nr:YceI family protein [Ignavibacteria bacterium]